MPAGGIPVPFAGRPYQSDNNIAELIMRAGQQRAALQQQMFQGLAGSVEQLGQIPGQIQRHKQIEAQTKLEEARAGREETLAKTQQARLEQEQKTMSEGAQQDQKFMGLLQSGQDPDPRAILEIYGPHRGLEIIKGMAAYKEVGRKSGAEALKEVPDLVNAYAQLSPEGRTIFWPHLRELAVKAQIVDPTKVPEQRSDDFDAQVIKFGQGLKEQKPPSFQHVETAKGIQAFDQTKGSLGPVLAPGKQPEPKEPKLYQVDTVDADGNPIKTFVAEADARKMAAGGPGLKKPPSTTVQNREAAAKSSITAGEELLSKLSDPKITEKLGPIVGRYNSLTAAAGAGDPIAQELVGAIKSFSALQPQIHGFRAFQMGQDIEHLLTTKQTPEALAAALRGILTASYIVAGQEPGGGKKLKVLSITKEKD